MKLEPVLAYLDPGTGSVLLQVLAGAVFGVGYAFRGALRRAVDYLTGRARPGQK